VKRLLALLPLLAGAATLAVVPAGPALASAAHPVTTPALNHLRNGVTPGYEQDLSSTIRCATWSGTLSWGGNGSIVVPAYIDISGKLTDNCNNGYAQLFLHYDTIDNPKEPKVKQIGPNSSANTPFSTEDNLNTYKDIYVYICSEDSTGYRCGNHKGPGA
jgi:hypothetical protein